MAALYFDLLCGASGDMILAALVDLGVDLGRLREQLDALGIPGLALEESRDLRAGRSCRRLRIAWNEAAQREQRNLAAIRRLLERGGYPQRVLERSHRILHRLAEAESQVHRLPLDRVHFHETGAVDTVVDVLGFALSLEYLRIDRLFFSTLTVGSGTVETGWLLAPATIRLISGLRVRPLATGSEILTPTAAAILTAGGRQVPRKPSGEVLGRGYGCGQKRLPGFRDYLEVIHFLPGDRAIPPGGDGGG